MSSTKNALIQYKSTPFLFEEAVILTGLSKSSTRNLISELIKSGMLITSKSETDRRKKLYSLNWKYVVDKLKNPDGDYDDIIQRLSLNSWNTKHVMLKDFIVIDFDESLSKLLERNWYQTPSSDIVIVTIGTSKDVLTIEFGSE